jgi:hypothetical protein
MFHCAIGPPGHHTPNTFSQEWSLGTPWGGFDPSHHPLVLFWAPPGTTPTTLQRVVKNTAFLSESGSWDNMVCLSTKSFPGAHFWLTKVSSAKTPPKTPPHVLTQYITPGPSGMPLTIPSGPEPLWVHSRPTWPVVPSQPPVYAPSGETTAPWFIARIADQNSTINYLEL